MKKVTSYGLEYIVTSEMNKKWTDYQKKVAESHLGNYGFIIVETDYNSPIDNMFDIEQVLNDLNK